MSMSDTSTLVTINTYESSATASNPSLTQSRRGVAGSVSATDTNSMDGTAVISYRCISPIMEGTGHHHVAGW